MKPPLVEAFHEPASVVAENGRFDDDDVRDAGLDQLHGVWMDERLR
jgi:hypothetical protein